MVERGGTTSGRSASSPPTSPSGLVSSEKPANTTLEWVGRRHPGRRRCRYARFLVRLPQMDMEHQAADWFLERSKNA
jgi:hypothetical protein